MDVIYAGAAKKSGGGGGVVVVTKSRYNQDVCENSSSWSSYNGINVFSSVNGSYLYLKNVVPERENKIYNMRWKLNNSYETQIILYLGGFHIYYESNLGGVYFWNGSQDVLIRDSIINDRWYHIQVKLLPNNTCNVRMVDTTDGSSTDWISGSYSENLDSNNLFWGADLNGNRSITHSALDFGYNNDGYNTNITDLNGNLLWAKYNPVKYANELMENSTISSGWIKSLDNINPAVLELYKKGYKDEYKVVMVGDAGKFRNIKFKYVNDDTLHILADGTKDVTNLIDGKYSYRYGMFGNFDYMMILQISSTQGNKIYHYRGNIKNEYITEIELEGEIDSIVFGIGNTAQYTDCSSPNGRNDFKDYKYLSVQDLSGNLKYLYTNEREVFPKS